MAQVQEECNFIQNLGDITMNRSDHDLTRQRFEQVMPLYGQVRDVTGEAGCLFSLGTISLRRSDHATARQRFEQVLPLFRQGGDVLREANCIKGLGDIALRRSDHDAARQRYEEALDLYERIPEPYSIGEAHYKLAQVIQEETEKEGHVQAARSAWTSIGFDHELKRLDVEFRAAG